MCVVMWIVLWGFGDGGGFDAISQSRSSARVHLSTGVISKPGETERQAGSFPKRRPTPNGGPRTPVDPQSRGERRFFGGRSGVGLKIWTRG